jgi:hypothetical protein
MARRRRNRSRYDYEPERRYRSRLGFTTQISIVFLMVFLAFVSYKLGSMGFLAGYKLGLTGILAGV